MNGIYCPQTVQIINYPQMTQMNADIDRKTGDAPGAFSY